MSKWLEFKNSTANKPAEILIYGEIGDYWDGLDATSLAQSIKQAAGDTINVRLNTPGGSVFAAQAFYSLLRASGKTINMFIDGICASAGTIISSAGDHVYMPENTLFMIHNPMTSLYGANADEMRETADILDKVQATIIAAYQKKTGQSEEKLKELMSKDTYLTAQEAKDLGFIDEITEPFAVAATLKDGILAMNGVKTDASWIKNLPTHAVNIVESSNKSQGDDHPMNLEELKAKAPEVYAAALEEGKKAIDTKAIADAAAKAERERIKSIQDAANVGHESIVAQAIENGWDAGQFALAAMKADKEAGKTAFENRKNDAAVVANVPVTAAPEANTEDDSIDAALDAAFNGV